MDWWQTLIVTLVTIVVTKATDEAMAWFKDKREFRKFQRDKAYSEIDELKSEIGWIYQVGANWKGFELKETDLKKIAETEDRLVGRYNKYPDIASTAKDVVHWCKIVCYAEKSHEVDVFEAKNNLIEKYKAFSKACEKFFQ